MHTAPFLQAQLDPTALTKLKELPFLLAAIEDASAAQAISAQAMPNARHIVTLMHDAIEFLLYEILISDEVDTYDSGQSTIGINEALKRYTAQHRDPPLIASIRSIQKHRGDAKHHGQVPDVDALRRMQSDFPVLMSRLIFRHFGQTLTEAGLAKHFLPLHIAHFQSFRKYRNRNWKKAFSSAIQALLHAIRSTFNLPEDFDASGIADPKGLVGLFAKDLSLLQQANRLSGPASTFTNSLAKLQEAVTAEDLKIATQRAAEMYDILQRDDPSIFDAKTATYFTEFLALPKAFRYRPAMSWSKGARGDTEGMRQATVSLAELLRAEAGLVARLGAPEYDDDGDRYWQWWELAVFDGEEWQTAHLHHDFSVAWESGSFSEDWSTRRERAAVAALEQFRRAAATCTEQAG